jgi:hypothetical protein
MKPPDPLTPKQRAMVDSASAIVIAETLGCRIKERERDERLRRDQRYPLYPPVTDPTTVYQLWERYSPERATDIIAGRDEATARDIAAWRGLGRR